MEKQTIVVVESGWVFVGVITSETNENILLENASVIRRWGTTRGLGELAISGATSETKLEPCMIANIQKQKILFTIPCQVVI